MADNFTPSPCWFTLNNSETVKVVTLAFCCIQLLFIREITAWKVSKCGVFSGRIFLHSENAEIYGVNFRIQSEYRKIQTRKNSVFGKFSRSEFVSNLVSLTCLSLQILGKVEKGLFLWFPDIFSILYKRKWS